MKRFLSYISLLFIAVSFLGLSSCYPEWKIAKSYIDSKPDVSVMILPSDYIFKNNLKIDELGDTTEMTVWELDSALMAGSLFLNDISDSIFLETFINSMIEEFEKLGFKVYTESSLDSFLFIRSTAYILNIAQIEVEEHYYEYEDSQNFDDYVYYKTMDLNAVSFNNWFELTKLNPKEEGRKVFYAYETIADQINGYFAENIFTGEVKYKYYINEIDTDIIYRYCEILGRRYAGYTYDYIMNEHIAKNFPANKKRRYYMRYNRQNNSLDPASRNRFIILEK